MNTHSLIAACLLLCDGTLIGAPPESSDEVTVRVFEMVEVAFTGSGNYENPYMEVDLWVDLNGPDQALAVNYLRINPGYWQQVDRKMQFFWDSGFTPFIETVRRSEAWPEEADAERAAFTNYVRYLWARYGVYNWIFSWLHWDWGEGRNEDYRPMIDAAYAALGDMPYGQPMTAMAAGASDDTWGTGSEAPWLRLHNVSNVGRDARMFAWLRRQHALPDPLPAMNVEPFYPGWNNKATKPLNDDEMAQFMMYGSVLNGGFGGHAWGDDYYSGVRKFGGDPHVNGFNKWRVWNGGTTRVFQWGDPDWVKLFVEGSHLYDAVGFELNEPLYFKMNGSPHGAAVTPLLNPDYRYYNYEFERYWHFYQLVGRLAYNPNTPDELWDREFSRRFGSETGAHLKRALHQASKVLPRIVAASYLYTRFPSPQGWPELQRMEDLPHFALNSRPSDIQQFASPMEEAELILNGGSSPKRLPSQTSAWFQETSDRILADVVRAGQSGDNKGGREYLSTVTDLKMLAHLAGYHSHRLRAAVHYALFEKTGDLVSLDWAVQWESEAVAAYGRVVESAGYVYAAKLDFGSNRSLFPGHWKNEHQRLRQELDELRTAPTTRRSSALAHVPVRRCLLKEPIVVSATAPDLTIKSLRIKYSPGGEPYKTLGMHIVEEGIWSGKIPNPGTGQRLNYYLESVDSSGTTTFLPKDGAEAPYVVTISDDREPPVADLERIARANLDRDLNVSARVTDPSEVKSVVLRYRRVSQFEDYQSAPMTLNAASRKYEAVIPAEFLGGQHDVMYFIEVMDTKGNGRMVPDLEVETPYVIVKLNRKDVWDR